MDVFQNTDVEAVADRLAHVRERIARACRRAGRSAEDVTLIAVTKTFPLETSVAAREVGLADFGENRAQDLVEKAEQLPGALHGGAVRWHMIGHLQRNKAKDVVAHADLFHALDSPRLAKELDRRAGQAGRLMPCLVQVNVSGETSKYGLEPDEALAFLGSLERYAHLRVLGLMTLAAPTEDPEQVRPQFRRLRELRERHNARAGAALPYLSMGMSGDFEVALEEGATHIRLGTALFGPRQA